MLCILLKFCTLYAFLLVLLNCSDFFRKMSMQFLSNILLDPQLGIPVPCILSNNEQKNFKAFVFIEITDHILQ